MIKKVWPTEYENHCFASDSMKQSLTFDLKQDLQLN